MRSKVQAYRLRVALAFVFWIFATVPVWAQQPADESTKVMEGFNQLERQEQRANELTTKDKHRVMFGMGVVLLILVLLTAGLGIAMGVFGKPVFVAHMVSAGLAVTLAIAHSIVAIVWFFPF